MDWGTVLERETQKKTVRCYCVTPDWTLGQKKKHGYKCHWRRNWGNLSMNNRCMMCLNCVDFLVNSNSVMFVKGDVFVLEMVCKRI